MKRLLDECCKNSKILFTESGRKFYIINKEKKTVGYIKGEKTGNGEKGDLRCDYIIGLYVDSLKSDEKDSSSLKEVVFLELKGCDIKHALEQLEKTIILFRSCLKKVKSKKAFIVATSYPSFTATMSSIITRVKKNDKIVIEQKKMQFEYNPAI